jgi:hypothetical protein
MKFIDEWQKAFKGPLFFCEYHMYIHQYNDPGFMDFSRKWLDDIKAMKEFQVSGMMNIQTQRSFFPNGLPINIYAAASFDTNLDFEKFTDKYFRLSYGNDYLLAKEYLESISALINSELLQMRKNIVDLDADSANKTNTIKPWVNNTKAQNNLKKVIDICTNFESIAKAKCSMNNTTQAKSWELLYYHTDFCKRYADILLEHSMGNIEKAQMLLAEFTDVFSKSEEIIGSQFDLFLFENSVRRKFV